MNKTARPTILTLAVLLLAPLSSVCAAEVPAAKPNIVYILCDDLGYGDVHCLGGEPYCFSGPYEKLNLQPMLSLDVKGIDDPKGQVGKIVRYVAWIKPYEKGRVFYCSPSHIPESYETSTLLQFLLDGVQYASGDLNCDDSKLKK
jgi:hypothetical protein